MKRFIALLVILSFSFSYAEIIDETASELNQNLKIKKVEVEPVEDFMLQYIDKSKLKSKTLKGETGEFKISPVEKISTSKKPKIGSYVDFKLLEDTFINSKLYKKGTIVKGRVENITQNGIYGMPSDIVIDNFNINNEIYLEGTINKKGADRSIWVYPCSYIFSGFLIGLLFIPIKGGHAKLNPKEVFIIGD